MSRHSVWCAVLAALGIVFGASAAEPWKVRAVQLDLGRQKETVPFLKAYAERIAAVGYNTFVLYLEGRVKTASVPFMKDEECYTPDEMREVVAHATKLGLDVVPVVSILGHANLFTRYAAVKPLAEGRDNKGWVGSTFCLSKPETRAFVEKYVAEVAELFPSKNFHMGFDEAWDMGTCELCAPIRKAKGMGPLFTEFVKFAHSLCAKNGKRMWMWDDLYEFFPEELANCPKDIVMCDWKYEPVSPWGIRARFADSMRTDWMAVYAMHGIECLAACNVNGENIRTFTDYAKKHPNCLGGFVTQWEMSAMNHGIRFPMVLAAGLYWSQAFDDPAFDFIAAGTKAAFPSLSGVELQAATTLVAEQTKGHLARPRARENANLRGMMRGVGPRADDLAVAVLKRSALRPGEGEVAPEPLSEKALLDDLVTDVEFSRFNDLFREVEPMLRSPERTIEQVRSAKAKLAKAEPELRRICERRWAQRNAWRGDMRPWEFPGANWGEKYVKGLLATPETPAEADEWWLVVDINLPDWFGNLELDVYGSFDGAWRKIASGDWKPSVGDRDCYQAVAPFRAKTAPTALRIVSARGIGICGVNYIACVNRSQRLVPRTVLSASGYVKDAANILVDNLYPAVFGFPDRYRNAFHPDGKKTFAGTLEVSLGESPDLAEKTPVRRETARWQRAIDAASAAGGGTVTMPAGRHVVGTLFLRSGVTLELAKGCVLEGSTNLADYANIHLKYAEIREPWQALVAAEGQRDISVVGEGEIFGNGKGFPFDTRLGRPRGMLFSGCSNVRVEGITMRDLASWTCYYKECDGVVHRNVKVDSHANGNADGVDIEARNVLVEGCEIDCDDDGIVLKSDNPDFLVENVEVRNCEVRSCCSLF